MRQTPLDEVLNLPGGAAEVFLDVVGGMKPSDAIERQEASGQARAVQQQALPINGTFRERHIYERLGFVFGDNRDNLFVNVTFPEGWSLKATDHSMWSDLLDDQGRKRGGMFYKAAFYDEDASINLARRYGINQYPDDCPDGMVKVDVRDGQTVIHSVEAEVGDRRKWDVQDELAAEAKAWLSETYPDWENVEAYW